MYYYRLHLQYSLACNAAHGVNTWATLSYMISQSMNTTLHIESTLSLCACLQNCAAKKKLVSSRGVSSIGENTRNSKDSGSKSSPSFRTSVFNVRCIKSEHRKNLKKVKIATSKVSMNHVSSSDNKLGFLRGCTFCLNLMV